MPCQPDTTRTFLEVVFTQALVGVVVVLVESVLPVWCALVGHVGADCRCCGIVSGKRLVAGGEIEIASCSKQQRRAFQTRAP